MDWPCWPEPRPKATEHTDALPQALEAKSLGEQSSTRRASTGRASVPQCGDPRGGIDSLPPPLRPARFALWVKLEPDRLEHRKQTRGERTSAPSDDAWRSASMSQREKLTNDKAAA